MMKGYWIVHGDVSDAEQYKKYQAANAAPLREYGARFLVRGGASTLVEGHARSRHVIIEFPTYQAALDCWKSQRYQLAIALRKPASEADIVVVEGYEGPQP